MPKFRYESTKLDFEGEIYAPSFPVRAGTRQHTYPTNKPAYTVTGRNYGTTETAWRTEDIKQTNRDTIYSFWGTTLVKGYNDFTAIDNRNRMLFDASWNNWSSGWSKRNGGLYNVDYGLQSPVTWTPPTFGAYPMADDTLTNHLLDDTALAAQDGALTSTDILRTTGSALTVTGANSASGLTGASGPVNWEAENKYNNLTVFCQAKVPLIDTGVFNVIEVDLLGNNKFKISMEASDASNNSVYGSILNGGAPTEIRKAVGSYHQATLDTWYDIALTYDAVNGNNYLYVIASDTTTFTDFLSGAATEDEQIGEYNSNSLNVADIKWKNCYLLREEVADCLSDGEIAYLQNAFVFDGYLSPIEFNMMRRLCFMWNAKTEVYPK